MTSLHSPFSTGTPRNIPFLLTLRILFGDLFALISLIFLLAGGFMAFIFLSESDFKSAFIFRDSDPKTEAVVDSQTGTSNYFNDRQIYDYAYHYSVNGVPYTGHSFSSTSDARAGDTLTAFYKADQAELSHLQDMDTAPFNLWINALMLIGPVTGLILGIIAFRKTTRYLHLLKHGLLTTGKILRKEATRMEINDRKVYKIYFQFKAQDNSLREAFVKSHRIERFSDETEEPVIYDPLKPSTAILLGVLPQKARTFVNSF